MATLVCFHAHPDDEAIGSGGTLARAAAEGHRVVVVFATRGEHGEVPEGLLDPGEQLWQRRSKEALDAAAILGVHRVEFLGYCDSGMMGWAANDAPGSFWSADVEVAAVALAEILNEERANVLTIYDPIGVTGHPDHIQVHRVGRRAGALAGTEPVYEGTMARSQVMRLMGRAIELGAAARVDVNLDGFGTPDELVVAVDVRAYLDVKRRAIAAHASQVSETSFFLNLESDRFAQAWGYEYFIREEGRNGSGPLEHLRDA